MIVLDEINKDKTISVHHGAAFTRVYIEDGKESSMITLSDEGIDELVELLLTRSMEVV